jgi:hypothetical protein
MAGASAMKIISEAAIEGGENKAGGLAKAA